MIGDSVHQNGFGLSFRYIGKNIPMQLDKMISDTSDRDFGTLPMRTSASYALDTSEKMSRVNLIQANKLSIFSNFQVMGKIW